MQNLIRKIVSIRLKRLLGPDLTKFTALNHQLSLS